MVTEAQRAAMKRYSLKTKQLIIRLRLEGDADVISRLDKVPNKTAYIRKLVREDMAREA